MFASACLRPPVLTHTHTWMHTCMHACVRTHTHTPTHTLTHSNTHTHKKTHTCCVYMLLDARMHACSSVPKPTCINTHTHTLANIYTHLQILTNIYPPTPPHPTPPPPPRPRPLTCLSRCTTQNKADLCDVREKKEISPIRCKPWDKPWQTDALSSPLDLLSEVTYMYFSLRLCLLKVMITSTSGILFLWCILNKWNLVWRCILNDGAVRQKWPVSWMTIISCLMFRIFF